MMMSDVCFLRIWGFKGELTDVCATSESNYRLL